MAAWHVDIRVHRMQPPLAINRSIAAAVMAFCKHGAAPQCLLRQAARPCAIQARVTVNSQQLSLDVGLADAFRWRKAATHWSVPGWRTNLAQVKGCHANLSMAGTCRNRSCEGVQVKSCSSKCRLVARAVGQQTGRGSAPGAVHQGQCIRAEPRPRLLHAVRK